MEIVNFCFIIFVWEIEACVNIFYVKSQKLSEKNVARLNKNYYPPIPTITRIWRLNFDCWACDIPVIFSQNWLTKYFTIWCRLVVCSADDAVGLCTFVFLFILIEWIPNICIFVEPFEYVGNWGSQQNWRVLVVKCCLTIMRNCKCVLNYFCVRNCV